jgi:hypothetical protein
MPKVHQIHASSAIPQNRAAIILLIPANTALPPTPGLRYSEDPDSNADKRPPRQVLKPLVQPAGLARRLPRENRTLPKKLCETLPVARPTNPNS